MAHEEAKCARVRVAVVGSGMAGLVMAWLLQHDSNNRYEVQLLESGEETSLDSASVSVVDPVSKVIDRIDVPMRAFTEGYYHNLKAMYNHLGVRYRVQPFLFSFSRLPKHTEPGVEKAYFIHASNNHQLPPQRPQAMGWITYLRELILVLICYIWFGAACMLVPAHASRQGSCENLQEYLGRIRLPVYFVNYYLLPLISAVTTCSHQALLQFPAKDVVEYKRCITSGRQLVVSDGVQKVQQRLLEGLTVQYSATVQGVERCKIGVKVIWKDSSSDGPLSEAVFDKVVLAVPPNVVGAVFKPLTKAMQMLPTTRVETVVHHDRTAVPSLDHLQAHKPLIKLGQNVSATQVIHLRTRSGPVIGTEATHVQPSGAMVTSCPHQPVSPSCVVSSSTFTRVLRTPESRRIINKIFELDNRAAPRDEKGSWTNGDDGVFLVGSWCWDGMVLLEGCVVSAVRTARALGVSIPWDRPQDFSLDPIYVDE